VSVIALIGERGREVQEFLNNSLGPEGLARCVVVVSTGDDAPLLRVRAAKVATTIAEYFRDAGKNVLLLMDSLTRMCHAQRQIGLAAKEPPATRGYPPERVRAAAGSFRARRPHANRIDHGLLHGSRRGRRFQRTRRRTPSRESPTANSG
jgi:flagellum-specific ATP synthase